MVRAISAFVAAGLTLFGLGSLTAQDGVSSAGHARARYLATMAVLPDPADIVVEHIINYHRHQLRPPTAGRAVSLDLRWGQTVDRTAVLQIGLATPRLLDRDRLPPLNLALVVDTSGSMNSGDKIHRVVQALHRFLDQLRPTDRVAVISYASKADVVLTGTKIGEGRRHHRAIRSLKPTGSTNLHAGLMLGYREVASGFRNHATNRVILLTDGIANTGVTEPDQILTDSRDFNREGIDLTTIGVGIDLNKDLLGELATSGRGLFHFVADGEDIQKVFVDEMQSLVGPVARKVRLEITSGDSLELSRLYGYDARQHEGGLVLDLDDLNHGATQVALLEYRVPAKHRESWQPAVKVRLSYVDERDRERVTVQESIAVLPTEDIPGAFQDHEVRKNHTIAVLAQAMHDMAVLGERNHYRAGLRALDRAHSLASEIYPHAEDEDIRRVLEMVCDYRRVLRERVRNR